MDDFTPYFTNDGSVGLYSHKAGDIYHSTYGALSEAYLKFILPSNIYDVIQKNKAINVLDVCYGIGYNTKSFINYFLENFTQKKIKKNINHTGYIDTICTDNIQNLKNENHNPYIESIDDNNIQEKNEDFILCNDAIYVDNIEETKVKNFQKFLKKIKNFQKKSKIFKESKKELDKYDNYKVHIHALEIDENLVKLSPMIKSSSNTFFINKKENKIDVDKVNKFLNKKNNSKIKFKISSEVDFIVAINLIKKYGEDFLDDEINHVIKNKKFKKFFRQKTIDFIKFYSKLGCKHPQNKNKSTFLHNIYYQYISNCYKNTLKVLENNDISILYDVDDARKSILKSKMTYDFVFLDAFTPAKVPCLWTYEFISEIYKRMNNNGMLLTYSNSATIRNTFLKCGFYIGKIIDENNPNASGTIATKNKSLIKHKLNEYELGLLNTRAGIMYRDNESLTLSNEEIINNRNEEVKNSSLISTTKFIKNYNGDKNEI